MNKPDYNYISVKEMKHSMKQLYKKYKSSEFNAVAKAAEVMIRKKGDYRFTAKKNVPVFSGLFNSLDNADMLINAIESLNSDRLTNMDFEELPFLLSYGILKSQLTQDEMNSLLSKIRYIDFQKVNSINPLHKFLETDETYRMSTPETMALYRRILSESSIATGLDEGRLGSEAIALARRNNTGVGEIIFSDRKRIFPPTKAKTYIYGHFITSGILLLLVCLSTGWWGLLLAFPVLAIGKTIWDYAAVAKVEYPEVFLPRLEWEYTDEIRCLATVSIIVKTPEDMKKAIEHVGEIMNINGNEQIKYCLLCDLFAADSEKLAEDIPIINTAKQNASDITIIIRNRTYSKTQRKWQGYERKRGAIEQLTERICGENTDFRFIIGSENLDGITHLCVLDYDTIPLMGSIRELMKIAAHPLNKRYGILCPSVSPTLSSSLKTKFSRLMTGNGGSSCVGSYNVFAGDFNQTLFSNGIFTGKGLIDVKKFREKCCKTLPTEHILSHDILEGELMTTAFVGDVEFLDSFPATSKAYFKRLSRWYRGDLQNVPFIFDGRFSALSHYRIFDNVRRLLTPFFIFRGIILAPFSPAPFEITVTCLTALLLPYVIRLICAAGELRLKTRRFYSPIFAETCQISLQGLTELILLPEYSIVSADAFMRVIWRSIRKRNLLSWTTSDAFEKTKFSLAHLIWAEVLSVFSAFIAIYTTDLFLMILSVIFLAVLPFMAYCKSEIKENSLYINPEIRKGITDCAAAMWNYYTDFVTKENNYLPPDNVQFYPVKRIARRTSPTNIGFYILSCLAAWDFGFITEDECVIRISDTLDTVEKLKKWHGNLYNWYDTESLNVISPFVSSVDSGNFLTALCAAETALKSHRKLYFRIMNIRLAADLAAFYNPVLCLFSVGYDTVANRLSESHYDLLMSESRLTAYYAVASGTVPKKHYSCLGRSMARFQRRAAPIAWTGTMFEYFMPELLIKSREGSISYEALCLAYNAQLSYAHRRGTPFGVSESAYYDFDTSLNYLYNPNGVQAAALKGNTGERNIVSPYSSFLTLCHETEESYNNLVRLRRFGCYNERYGFYEAIDFSGEPHVIKSFMAHHVGMSLTACANLIYGGIMQKRFMENEEMSRGKELLEERIRTGEQIAVEKKTVEKEKITPLSADIFAPDLRLLSNGSISVIASSLGMTSERYKDMSLTILPKRLNDFSRGCVCGFFSGHSIPMSPIENNNFTASYDDGIMTYEANDGENFRVDIYVHESLPVVYRRFSSGDKSAVFSAFFDLALCNENEYFSHPAFMDMFIKIRYDESRKLFIVSRKAKESDSRIFMAAGFTKDCGFTYSLSRRDLIKRNESVFSAVTSAPVNESNSAFVPSPCLMVRSDCKEENELFVCASDNLDDLFNICEKARSSHSAAGDIFGTDRECIALGAAILPPLFYHNKMGKLISSAARTNKQKRSDLWKADISGDYPIIAADGNIDTDCLLKTHRILTDNGIISDLVFTDKESRSSDSHVHYPQKKQRLNELIYAAAAVVTDEEFLNGGYNRSVPRKIEKCRGAEGKNGFVNGPYVINETPDRPYSNVLANQNFGTLVSDCSLGFSWAINSRENKLSPWDNNPAFDNTGERLYIDTDNTLYDGINGSSAVFAPNKADYVSICGKLNIKTSVRVFRKGMGKKISLLFENAGNDEVSADIIYCVRPILSDKLLSPFALVPERRGDILTVTNSLDGKICGALTLSTDKKCDFITDETKILYGNYDEDISPNPFICAAAHIKIKLPPRSSEKIRYILGFTMNKTNPETLTEALSYQKTAFFPENQIVIDTPDENLNLLFNKYLSWQALGARMWARTGYYQNGGAYGFRDQLQDSLAAMYIVPAECKYQLLRCCHVQFQEGDVLHWWHRTTDRIYGVRTRCSDDLLWLPYALCCYIDFSGDIDLLSVNVPYIYGEKLKRDETQSYLEASASDITATVYTHAKKAVEYAFSQGRHKLIHIGGGDWCDGFDRMGEKGKGESVWLTMFYIIVCRKMSRLARLKNENSYAEELEKRCAELKNAVEDSAFTNNRYIRAFTDENIPVGDGNGTACRIDILPQAFSIFSDMDISRSTMALKTAEDELVDVKNGIIKLFTPPFDETCPYDPGYIKSYPPGIRENGGQYTHGAIWFVMAMLKSGHFEKGMDYLNMLSPAANNGFGNEPYYMTADIYTNPDCFKMGGWSIYTGSAAWYYKCILETLIGVSISDGKLTVNPALPDNYPFSLSLQLGDTDILITSKVGRGKMYINNVEADSVPLDGKAHFIEIK